MAKDRAGAIPEQQKRLMARARAVAKRRDAEGLRLSLRRQALQAGLPPETVMNLAKGRCVSEDKMVVLERYYKSLDGEA